MVRDDELPCSSLAVFAKQCNTRKPKAVCWYIFGCFEPESQLVGLILCFFLFDGLFSSSFFASLACHLIFVEAIITIILPRVESSRM
ncbi:hypothetical protein M758_8G108700 [Ceratodon purpureus]|nr:hypothetical protein M758_8G108700 [Ceratodon purpureus]